MLGPLFLTFIPSSSHERGPIGFCSTSMAHAAGEQEIQLWPSAALKGQGQGRKESPGALMVARVGFGAGLRKGGGGTFICVAEFSWTLPVHWALRWLAR